MPVSPLIINKKIIAMLAVTTLFFSIIIVRLVYLQVYCSGHFLIKSNNNFIRHETIHSPRGNIKDVHGNLLATNRPITLLYWQGTGKNSLSGEQKELLKHLESIAGITVTSGTLFDSIMYAERKSQKLLLMSDIDFTTLSKLSESFTHDKNIIVDTHFKRFYPYNKCASHIIGYLGNIRLLSNGQFGLEKIFNEDLCGKQGSKRKIVNSVGQQISQMELEKALSGNDIQTTIDIGMQTLCEKIFPEHQTGSFIVFNPSDGAIISLVSRPNFDPNIFLDPIPSTTWQTLQEKNPFLNRAFDASYPSGSIFKLVTISAALEHNIIQPDSSWNCKGYTLFGKRKYRCARLSGHGQMSIVRAVAESCNTLFFEIGKQIDIDLLAEYAYKFGLGQKTDIIFPEKPGLIPSREWKLYSKGERWWPGETLSVAIGQSFLLVTPIQIARMIASIFTGYLVSPRLLVNEPIITSPLDIKPETIIFLKKSMKSVIKKGTGRSLSKLKDMTIYAKTSTAQTSSLDKRKLDPNYLEDGWFVGHFQYKDHEPLVLVILVERVGAASVATTIAKKFLIEYKKYIDTQTPKIAP